MNWLNSWLYSRRLKSASKRMTALRPATNSEWFKGRSVAHVAESWSDPIARYSEQWYRSHPHYRPSSTFAENRAMIDAAEEGLAKMKQQQAEIHREAREAMNPRRREGHR